jgi:hypothetical protein
MGATDDRLDAVSRRLLDEVEEVRRLELAKRRTACGGRAFRDLAAKVDDAARHVFETASAELIDAADESPLQAERDERQPGDWTQGSRN